MKKFIAALALTAGISGVFAGTLATPASAAPLLCITVGIGTSGNVIPTTCI
jgi:hypothetical protein